ncbi:topoisomerase II [Pantoea sp. RRHST58]|uniref:topoisomerase II n=1 Tax=Pantoea sp. RRHST58 TaxID=3425183 RepID=UPI003DA1A620
MNWTHVLLAGYAGAVITAVVALIRKKGWVGRVGAVVLTLTAIVVWNVLDAHYLKNQANQNVEQQLDAAIATMPTWQVLKEQEPEKFEQMRAQSAAMIKAGKSEQQVIDYIQPQILAIQKSRLALAPDDRVVAVMQVNVAQIEAVQRVSDDACYRFLFPDVKGGINPTKIIPESITRQRMSADVAMMRAAWGPNRHSVTREEQQQAQQSARKVIQMMVPKYGQDLEILGDPRKGTGKEKIACNLYKDLWRNVLALPQSESAGVIRMAMAAE